MMDRHFWLAYACLAIVGLVLAFQAQQAISGVLNARSVVPSAPVAPDPGDRALLDELDRKERLLETRVGLMRDPFLSSGSFALPARVEAPRERPAPPTLRALLYEERSPAVQLQSGRDLSDWLGVGDVYNGWTIEEITPASVRLSSRGSSVVLVRS